MNRLDVHAPKVGIFWEIDEIGPINSASKRHDLASKRRLPYHCLNILAEMDLRIDKLKSSLIGKINATDDAEKLERILAAFDKDADDIAVTPMTKAMYVQRTEAALKSVAEGRTYSPDVVSKRLGIHGGK